jgi:hypothetical protein
MSSKAIDGMAKSANGALLSSRRQKLASVRAEPPQRTLLAEWRARPAKPAPVPNHVYVQLIDVFRVAEGEQQIVGALEGGPGRNQRQA